VLNSCRSVMSYICDVRGPVITHNIDTGTAAPVKQRFYRTSYQNQLFIKDEI
jgi:hypothetical protein